MTVLGSRKDSTLLNETEKSPKRLLAAPAWKHVIFAAAVVFCATPWGSPPLALAAGVVLALAIGNLYGRRGARLSKWLLQGCVVLLGFSMDLPTVLKAGAEGALFAVLSIGLTLLLGYAVGRWLRVSGKTSALISAGTAICGGSAIAAVSSVLAAAEGEITVALGTVFILNGVALYVFPILGHAMHLTQDQFGTWAGIAIHDISSVVGASTVYGASALQTATAVKLFRSLWIAPITLGFAYAQNTRRTAETSPDWSTNGSHGPATKAKPSIKAPWFIGLFLLASLIRSFSPAVAEASPAIANAAKLGMTLTLFLIGAGLSKQALRAVGWQALAQGALLWLFISAGSLAAIVWLN